VDAGSLVLDTTSTERSTASFSVAEGTGLDLEASTSATLTVGGASPFSGQGELESGHGYSGGTVVVSGRLGLPAVEVYGGTLDLDTSATLRHVTLDGDGTLGGTGDLTISPGGSLTTRNSGALSVSGDVTIDAGAALDLGASPVLDGKGRVIIDKGATATVEGSALVGIGQPVVNDGVLDLVTGGPQQTAGVITCGQAGGGSLTNYGFVDLVGDSSIFPVYGGSALNCVLINKGTVAKSAGTGTSVLGGVPDNAGTITIKSGTVTLLNTSGDDVPVQRATSTGTFDVAAGASLALANTYAGSVVLGPTSSVNGLDGGFGSLATTYENLNGGTDTIEGTLALPTIDVGEGTLDLAGTRPLALSSLTINENGVLSTAAALSVTSGGVAIGAASGQGGTLSGPGNLTIGPGATLDLDGFPTLSGTGTVTVDNSATVTVDAGAGVTLSRPMVNRGTLSLNSLSNPSTVTCASAGEVTNYGTIDLTRGSSINPTGCVVDKGPGTVKTLGTSAREVALREDWAHRTPRLRVALRLTGRTGRLPFAARRR